MGLLKTADGKNGPGVGEKYDSAVTRADLSEEFQSSDQTNCPEIARVYPCIPVSKDIIEMRPIFVNAKNAIWGGTGKRLSPGISTLLFYSDGLFPGEPFRTPIFKDTPLISWSPTVSSLVSPSVNCARSFSQGEGKGAK